MIFITPCGRGLLIKLKRFLLVAAMIDRVLHYDHTADDATKK
jgi:hypothetical protein